MKNAIKKGFRWIEIKATLSLIWIMVRASRTNIFIALTGFKLQNLIFQRRSLQKTERGKNKNFNWLTEMPLPGN